MKKEKDIIITGLSILALILFIMVANLEYQLKIVNDNMDVLRDKYIEIYEENN